MKYLETLFAFVVLTTMTIFTIALMKMVNEPCINASDVKAIMEYSAGIK